MQDSVNFVQNTPCTSEITPVPVVYKKNISTIETNVHSTKEKINELCKESKISADYVDDSSADDTHTFQGM